MNRKIWKALGIAVCMLALAVPHAMAETNSHYVSNDGIFKKVIEKINNSSDDNENEIILMNGFTLEGDTTEYTLRRGTTTIKGEGNTITVNSGAGIKVTGGKTVLNLGAEGYAEKLTIDGNAKGAFITVSGGATAYMYENVTLQNRQQVDQACVVLEENSVFNMHGGVIQNCKGKYGGVSLKNGSRFIMEGGTISECSASEGGGLYAENSTVTIKGGTISGCSAYAGGGLCAENFSTIEISGGTISGCTTSEAGMGGGLYAYKSTITISRGTIENNKATYGGGVALSDSTINPITNWTVIGNEAYKTKRGNGGIGGGIYLESRSMNVSAGSNRIYNNQAEGHGADICLEKGASITLPDAANMGATYLDSGIKIDNWYNDKPPYTGKAVTSLQLNGKCSLVAWYEASPVRIEIDANGGVGGSGSQTAQKGTTVTLEAPTKEGHLFKGWKDEKGNGYPAGEDGKVKITVTGDMTLTAVWEARTFTVTYVLLDGKTRTETAAYGQNVTLGEEPRTGYTFVGWKDGEKVYRAGETITVNEDMKLTAVWEARTFTVTYVLLDGKTRTETVAYGQKLTLGEEPRTGYTFVGWKDGEKMYHAGETITVTEDKTLTAVWDTRSFTVTYVLLNGKTRTETAAYGQNVTLGEEPRTGYTFVGWKDGEKVYYAGETITVTEDKTLTAVWDTRSFTVTYVLLNGKTRTETAAYGQNVTLGEEPRTGYTFVGWKDGEKMYHAGETITVTEDKTLTAVWDTRSFTVTYVLLNGKTRTETAAYGQNVTLGEEPRTGYTFVGWKDGEKMYHAGETITVTEDKTLTAVWDTRSFTVTYVLLDGKTRTETAAYGQNVTLGEEPRTGYTFVGWKDGEKMYHAGETITVTEDMTLTAEWEKLPSAENLPKTGDESPVLLWSAVLAVSAAAGFMLKRKK